MGQSADIADLITSPPRTSHPSCFPSSRFHCISDSPPSRYAVINLTKEARYVEYASASNDDDGVDDAGYG
jgi:hypothetical protein